MVQVELLELETDGAEVLEDGRVDHVAMAGNHGNQRGNQDTTRQHCRLCTASDSTLVYKGTGGQYCSHDSFDGGGRWWLLSDVPIHNGSQNSDTICPPA